jgi:hypothetical protein
MTAASCVHKAVHYLAHDHRPFAPARLAGQDQRRDDRYPSDVTDEEWELIVPATPNPYISHYLCMIGQICDETRLLFCRCGTPWHLETRECLNDYLTTKVAKRSRWAWG